MSIIESTAYDAPGESGSPVELKERYENFIGGRVDRSDHRGVPRESDSVDGRAVLRGRAFRCAGHRAGARRGARGQG